MNILLTPFFIFCVTLNSGDYIETDDLMPHNNGINSHIVEQTFCSPYDDIQSQLVALLQSAKTECLVAVYTLNSPVLVNTLIDLHKRGVDVEVITDSTQAAGKHEAEALGYLRGNGIPVFVGKSKFHQIMHVKMAIIDNTSVAYGSYNWTDVANRQDNTLTIENNPQLADQLHHYWVQIREDMK